MTTEETKRGFGDIFLDALFSIPSVVNSTLETQKQLELENALIAHARNQPHNQNICTSCSPVKQVKDCTKHEFGACFVDCRYRTGVPGDCRYAASRLFHGDGLCEANCYGRP